LATLVGCGGGDGGDSTSSTSTDSTSSTSIDTKQEFSLAAYKDLTEGTVFSSGLTGNDSKGNSFSGSITVTNRPQELLGDVLVTPRDITISYTVNGTPIILTGTDYYDDAAFLLQSKVQPTAVTCISSSPYTVPDTVSTGDAGIFPSASCDDNTTRESDWRVEDAKDGKIYFILSYTIKDEFGSIISTGEDKYTVDSNNVLVGIEVTTTEISTGYTITVTGAVQNGYAYSSPTGSTISISGQQTQPSQPTPTNPEAKLLFKSSFDDVLLVRGKYGHHRLVGRDSKTGFIWPDHLPGITDYNFDQHYFNYVLASETYTSGEDVVLGNGTPGKDGIGDDYLKFVETRIDTLGSPGIPERPKDSLASKALYIEYKSDDPDDSGMSRVQYNMRANKTGDPVQRLDQGYVKATIFMHISPEARHTWLLPYEWKQEGEYGRIGIYIYNSTSSDAYWYAQMQDGTLGSSSPTIWSESNHTVPVPKDQWFTLEVYWVGSSDPTKGRLKVAVNGVIVFDIKNRTKRVGFDTPYYFSPFKHYGSTGHQWITDFEYRDVPPKNSVLAE
jgi:hypothetical protein